MCIGGGCTGNCVCPDGAEDCTAFTLKDGAPLIESEPAARLTNVSLTCGSGDTYAFGSDEPTTERAICTKIETTDDGIELPLHGSLIVAYATHPLEVFNTAVGGFPVDLNEDSPLCPGTGGVLCPGETRLNTAAAPLIAFGGDESAMLDYNGDGETDQVLSACESEVRFACADASPTPTPTLDPDRPCGATVLQSDPQKPIDLTGSTAGRDNLAKESECIWQGGPDQTFEYVAPADGLYDIEVEAVGFTPILYVRKESCLPEKDELGCAGDRLGEGRARIGALSLAPGQRIAIVVDSAGAGGEFRLTAKRRQPDLVVVPDGVAANPASANAGSQVGVQLSAQIKNVGDGDAGPFVVDFVLTRDAGGAEMVSIAPLRCPVANGLVAGQSTTCISPNAFSPPLIAEAEYFIAAHVDSNGEVNEADESNNAGSTPFSLGPPPGVILEPQVFRAGDGTVYHLVQAVPVLGSTPEGSFRITTLAASLATVATCETKGAALGSPLRAAVGTGAPLPLDQIQRTGILRVNSTGAAGFEDGNGGRLILGAGLGKIQICAQADLCGGAVAALVPISDARGGPPAACIASSASGPYCPDTTALQTIAFGVAQSGGECTAVSPSQLGIESQLCASAVTVPGLALQPGEAVVFISHPGREAVELGVGGFGVARGGVGSCGAGQITGTETWQKRQERAPVLSFVQAQRQTQANDPAISPDGRHVYVVGDGLLTTFARSTGGRLAPVDVERDGVDPVSGLRGVGIDSGIRGFSAVTLSPDGRNVYVASPGDDAVAAFARDTATGTLNFVHVQRDGVGGVAWLRRPSHVTVTPDGRHVYVASYDTETVSAFARDLGTGALSFVEVEGDGVDTWTGLAYRCR